MPLKENAQVNRPQHNQLWESVLSTLRIAIVTGQLKPGSHLVETELARQLNMSRGPVRDALIRLEQEGLVVHHPYRGKYVAELSATYIHEIYSLRLLLECYAFELAIQKLQPEHLQRLKELFEKMKEELAAGHFEKFADVDLEFHRLVLLVAEHKLLLQMWETLTNVVHALIAINASEHPGVMEIMSEGHDAILTALAKGDLAGAQTVLRAHLADAEANILRVMNQTHTTIPSSGENALNVAHSHSGWMTGGNDDLKPA